MSGVITPSIDPIPQRSLDPALTRSSSGRVQPPSATPGPSVGTWERTNSRIEGRRSQGIDGGWWPSSSPLPPNSRLKNFIAVTLMCQCRYLAPSDTWGEAAVQDVGGGERLEAKWHEARPSRHQRHRHLALPCVDCSDLYGNPVAALEPTGLLAAEHDERRRSEGEQIPS